MVALPSGRNANAGERMPTLNVRIDRRWDQVGQVRKEVESLVATAQGLQVEWVSDEEYESAADAARFRDFVGIARLTHGEQAVLDWATEELVESFGWRVDVSPD